MNLRQDGYWDQHYEEELKNFQDNGDEGEVWFGVPLTRRIINRIIQEIIDDEPKDESTSDISVLDVGCGNSFLLCTLAENAAKLLPNSTVARLQLYGIDYSANSVELSKTVVGTRKLTNLVHVKQCDFLDFDQVRQLNQGNGFNFIVDKGTFDAICLLSGDDAGPSIRRKYKHSIYAISRPGTIFILASCNHTEDELLALFDKDEDDICQFRHQLLGRIETPKIRFGGKEGFQVCCLVLKFT